MKALRWGKEVVEDKVVLVDTIVEEGLDFVADSTLVDLDKLEDM